MKSKTYSATIFEEIEFKYANEQIDYKEVDLTGNLNYGNHGIGRYECHGYVGNDVEMGFELDDITWDQHSYTPEENKIIDEYIEKNILKLEDKLIANNFE